MVEEMSIIALQTELSQQQCPLNYVVIDFFLCTKILITTWNINFQFFYCCIKEKKMEPIQHIKQDVKA
jgi:hypothetical protein